MALFNPGRFSHLLCDQWAQTPALRDHRPDPDQLASILEAAYLASLETEEGRSLRFGLIWKPTSEADDPDYVFARFGKPRPLSSAEIRRLAPATGLSSTFIAVDSGDSGPHIWGTVDVGSQWSQFRSAERSSGSGLPLHIVVTVTAPGTMSLRLGDMLIATVERGRPAQQSCNVLKFGPVHDFFRPAIQQLLEESVPEMTDQMSDPYFFASYGGEYLRFLTRTLRYAEELGHGATIIVLRESESLRVLASNLLTIKYSVSLDSLWPELRRYVRLMFEEIESGNLLDTAPTVPRKFVDQWRAARVASQKLGQCLVDRTRFLARLTQVDGALVITERLRVLGFGAVICDLSEAEPTVRSCKDELCRRHEERKREADGTRHKSAFSFCEQVDCVLFVLSQDGGVKALRSDGQHVLLWPSVALEPSAWFPTAEDVIQQLREQYLNRAV